ncbi:SpoVR family protein [Fictibacillus nanhaiensis]|nr:SpoVR family protein [Fictibacillus nanhaiensis]MCM3732781.1 SpoVR family protein [Fictibacillus nanhaiensis]
MSFIRNYLTKDLAQREDMYLFQKQGKEYSILNAFFLCHKLVMY